MADSGINNAGEADRNAAPRQTGNQRQRNHRNNTYHHEGIFMHYLFLNLSLRYASYFKSTARRLIEFFSLLNALFMFIILLYIHLTFVRNTSDCLNHVKDIWPRSGILRVQVSENESTPAYKLYFVKEPSSSSMSIQSTPYNIMLNYASPITKEDVVNFKLWKDLVAGKKSNLDTVAHSKDRCCPNEKRMNALHAFNLLNAKCPIVKEQYIKEFKKSIYSELASVVSDISVDYHDSDASAMYMKNELSYYENLESAYDPFEPSVIREHYIIEYSTEFGYLRLSTAARHKLAIPTLVVNLNPNVDECFGNGMKRYILKTFLGYDDFLMTSIKKLAEKDKSQGYLRNLITGEYFRFVTMWVSHASSFIAFTAMVIFTLIVTMLLRYSYHQIFMFMVEVLRLLDTDIRLVFPAAPMLTIILALVGMEEIMTEFFHDSTVAFYVILLIWGADQFDVICMHTVVGRRHWVRFFFLYHFSFYVYHYKFNGQYSKLALFTSWLFIFHSMLYFLHHYELPAIQRQMEAISERNRQRRNARNNNNSPDAEPQNEQDGDSEQQRPSDERNEQNTTEETEADRTDLPERLVSELQHSNEMEPEQPSNSNTDIDNFSFRFFKIRKADLCKVCIMLLALSGVLAILIHSKLTHSSQGLELVRVIT